MISKSWWQVLVPRQKIVNAVDDVIGDLRQHMVQSDVGVAPVQLGGADQRVTNGGAGEQVVATAGSTDNPLKLKQLLLQRGRSRCRAGEIDSDPISSLDQAPTRSHAKSLAEHPGPNTIHRFIIFR